MAEALACHAGNRAVKAVANGGKNRVVFSIRV